MKYNASDFVVVGGAGVGFSLALLGFVLSDDNRMGELTLPSTEGYRPYLSQAHDGALSLTTGYHPDPDNGFGGFHDRVAVPVVWADSCPEVTGKVVVFCGDSLPHYPTALAVYWVVAAAFSCDDDDWPARMVLVS